MRAGPVKAVAWCPDPAIRSAVRGIFARTADADILVAALPGIDPKESNLILKQISAGLEKAPKKESGPYGDVYNLLTAVGPHLNTAAKPLFVRYLDGASAWQCYIMCLILQATNKDWSVELLGPMLDDKRSTNYYQHPASEGAANSVDIRVCDAAAETLSLNMHDLKFSMIGTNGDLDRQIQAIKKQLARKKK